MFLTLIKRALGMAGPPLPHAGEGAGPAEAILLHGEASFPFDVMGVLRHQAQLHAVYQGLARSGERQEHIATLSIEGERPNERGAVAVSIAGQTVGYCTAYLATQYREWLQRWQLSNAAGRCLAVIVAGPDMNEDGTVQLSVKLDIELPFKMTTTDFRFE